MNEQHFQITQQSFDFLPHAFSQLLEAMRKIENEYRDMQDVEFTVLLPRIRALDSRMSVC